MTDNGNQQLVPVIQEADLAQIRGYQPVTAKAVEAVLAKGDLSLLSEKDRVRHYMNVCEALGLNWTTNPLQYIEFTENGQKKLTLYLTRGATDQIRMNLGVNVSIGKKWEEDGVMWITAIATLGERTFEATAGVPIEIEDGNWTESGNGKRYFKGNGQFKRLHGEKMINARLKLETKAYRRATLGIAGLGWLEQAGVSDTSIERLTDNTDNDPYSEGPNHERAILEMPRSADPLFMDEPPPVKRQTAEQKLANRATRQPQEGDQGVATLNEIFGKPAPNIRAEAPNIPAQGPNIDFGTPTVAVRREKSALLADFEQQWQRHNALGYTTDQTVNTSMGEAEIETRLNWLRARNDYEESVTEAASMNYPVDPMPEKPTRKWLLEQVAKHRQMMEPDGEAEPGLFEETK